MIFLIDRTYEQFLQKVVDAVLKVYDTYLLPDDLVGYYGLGQDWIFPVQPKGEGSEEAVARWRAAHTGTWAIAALEPRVGVVSTRNSSASAHVSPPVIKVVEHTKKWVKCNEKPSYCRISSRLKL